ncbi:MAG: hypothetical protein CVT66_06220 [Actinobacteria bacterium HGW-Actinobacteria-6]|nr:MAG: hypothetical protein CVT66_06220 [Actinobacteria bacterium HGW-Actinobacteria-6]
MRGLLGLVVAPPLACCGEFACWVAVAGAGEDALLALVEGCGDDAGLGGLDELCCLVSCCAGGSCSDDDGVGVGVGGDLGDRLLEGGFVAGPLWVVAIVNREALLGELVGDGAFACSWWAAEEDDSAGLVGGCGVGPVA